MRKTTEKMKLVVINACVRQGESRTLKIAEPVIRALAARYEVVRYDLPEMDGIVPLTPALFAARGAGEIPAWAAVAAWNMDYSTPEQVQARIDACVEEALSLVKAW